MALEFNIDGKQAIAELNRLSAAYDKQTKRLGKTLLEVQKLDKELTSLTASHKRLTAQVKLQGLELDKLSAKQTKTAASTKTLSNSQTVLGSAFRGTAGALGGLWLAYGQILPMMAAFATAMTVKDIIQKGAAFEYTATFIRTIGSAAGESTISVEALQEELLSMEGLRKGPLELAEGMREFAKAGVTVETGLKNIAELSRFATVAEIGLADATALVIGQANAFGESYADAANKITSAAMSSATSITEMAQAMSQTTELGSVSKMRFEEVAAALAVMANAGVRGSKAGTAVRTSIMRLQSPTSKLTGMFEKLGITFSAFDSDGAARGMLEMFQELDVKLNDLTDENRVKIIREMFGLRAMKGGANLIRMANQGLEEMIENVKKAAEGTTALQEAAAGLDETTVARWERLGVHWEKIVTGIKSGDAAKKIITLADGFLTFLEVITPLTGHKKLTELLMVETKVQQKALEDFAAKFGQVIAIVDDNKDAPGITEWAKNVREALGEVGVALEELDDRTPAQILEMEQFQAKAIHDAMTQVYNDEKEMGKKRVEAAKKLADRKVEIEKAQAKEIEKVDTDMWKAEQKRLKEEGKVKAKAKEEDLKLAEEYAEKKKDIEQDLTDKIMEMTLSEADYQRWTLAQQIKDMEDFLGTDSDLQDKITQYRILKLKEIASENSLTLTYMLDQWKEFGEDFKDSFSDAISGLITGDIRSLSDAWEGLMDSMIQSFADMIAEMLTRWLASGLMELVFGGGSFSGFSISGSGAGGLLGTASTAKEGYDAYQTGTGIVGAAKAGYEGYQAYGTVQSGLTSASSLYEGYVMSQGAAAASEAIGAEFAAIAAEKATEVGMMSSTGSSAGLSGGSTAGGASAMGTVATAVPILAILAAAYMGLRNSTPQELGNLIGTEGGPQDIQGAFSTSYLSAPSQDLGYSGEYTQKFMGLLDGVETASLDAAEGLLVLQGREKELFAAVDDNNETIGEASYRMVKYNEETQKWVDQTPKFEAMFETMQAIGPVTDAAVLSTAAMVAEMGGIPGVADELVSAYNEVAGTTAIAANSLEASLQQYMQATYGVTVSNQNATIATQHLAQAKAGDEGATRALTESLHRMGLSTVEASAAARALAGGTAGLTGTMSAAASATQALAHGSAAASEESTHLSKIVVDMGRAFSSAGSSAAGAMSKISSASARSPVSAHAGGGMIPGPITGIDNIYAGNINGVNQLVTGGEYIVNPRSTAKYKKQLDAINADKYSSGGQTPNIMSQVSALQNSGATNVAVHIYLSGRELTAEIDKVIVERDEQGVTGRAII